MYVLYITVAGRNDSLPNRYVGRIFTQQKYSVLKDQN